MDWTCSLDLTSTFYLHNLTGSGSCPMAGFGVSGVEPFRVTQFHSSLYSASLTHYECELTKRLTKCDRKVRKVGIKLLKCVITKNHLFKILYIIYYIRYSQMQARQTENICVYRR